MTQRILVVALLAICVAGSTALSAKGARASEMPPSESQPASVAGRALRGDGSSPRGPCRANLRMELDHRGAPEPALETPPDGKTSFSVPLNQTGYFQFPGVRTGRYVLVVACAEASGVREVSVQANREMRIDPPLLLEDLTLDIAVTPRTDPTGQPWQLTVDATMPRLRRIADKVSTAGGRWTQRGLNTGNYRVTISSSDGKQRLQRFFNLSAGSPQLLVRIPYMQVEGQVRLSTNPIRAQLTFFNDAGGEPVTLTSDDSGFFRGLVPMAPDATQRTMWTVEVRATQPAISRRLTGVRVQTAGEKSAWLDLALPVFAVHGTVVSQKGEPQSGVQVMFEDVSSGAQTSTATNDDGGFELQDLSPGKYTAIAESVEGTSHREMFQVVEREESELKLVLDQSERRSFYVVSSGGPVSDASVEVWIAPGIPWFFTHSGEDGRIDVKVPPGTTELGLTVGARGYALKLTRLRITSDDQESRKDANTITLDSAGGTLVLDLRPVGRNLGSSSTAYLVHDGDIEAAGTLVGWSTNQPYLSGGGPGVVETIEPGDYALCFLADPGQLTELWAGALPSDRCRKGSVDENGTLTLSPL